MKLCSLMVKTVDQLDYPSDDGRGLVKLRRTCLKQDGFFIVPQRSGFGLDTFQIFPEGSEGALTSYEDWYLGCIRRDPEGGYNVAISRWNSDDAGNAYLKYAPTIEDLQDTMSEIFDRNESVFMSAAGIPKWNVAMVDYFKLVGYKR